MNESYIVTLLVTVLVAIVFIYSLYCFIDLWVFKVKIVATGGHCKTKHLNIYRFLFRLNGGQGSGKVPDMLFKSGLALKIDGVITIVALIATIALIAISAALSVFSNMSAAIIINNQNSVEETTESSTDTTEATDENGDWVENKDDQRHPEESSVAETTEIRSEAAE